MTKQPEALRLASDLEIRRMDIDAYAKTDLDAAFELRRLHEVNVELLEALKAMQSYARAEGKGLRICDEVITKATRETE